MKISKSYIKFEEKILNNPEFKKEFEFIEKIDPITVRVRHKKCGTINTTKIYKYLKDWNICSNKECIKEKKKQNNIKKYGVEFPSQREDVRKKLKDAWKKVDKEGMVQKIKQTKKERYGSETYCNGEKISTKHGLKTIDEIKKINLKRSKTNIERYGSITPLLNEGIREKGKKTLLNNYGVDNPSKSKEIQNRKKQSNIEKYGVDHPMKLSENIQKMKNTNLERYGKESILSVDKIRDEIKKTNIEKYGVEYPMQNKSIQEKTMKTNIERYGVEFPIQSDIVKKKLQEKRYQNYYKEKIMNFEHIEPLFEEKEYNGVLTRNYKFKCKKCGNEFHSYLSNGHIPICTICYPPLKGMSKGESELGDFIKSFEKNVILNYRDKYEIDVFIPDKKIGFEYNGMYWHSDKFKEDNYHLNKTKYFEDKGIQIIHIFDNEWINKNKIIRSIIKSKLGLNEKVLYARKCQIKEVNSNDKKEFLNENHIQGTIGSNTNIGLYNGDELVSLMTFSKPRYSKKHEHELVRFCNKTNTSIIGGFSRLLKYFMKNNSGSIISYSDRRFSNGKIYEKNGFDFSHNAGPNFFYIKNRQIFSREKFQKHKLLGQLEFFNPELTAKENMQMNGYQIVYDSGNGVWINKNKE